MARSGTKRGLLAAVATALVITACGSDGAPATGSGGDPAGDDVEGTVTVLAAASLSDAFDDIAAAFETEHPGARVTIGYGASSSLARQAADGAPADALATADEATMELARETGLTAGRPALFARNRLELVVPAGNPAGVEGLDDLADGDLYVGLCAPEVPCGALARTVLDRAGVAPSVDSHEPDVRALLAKLAAGELDAGLVYRTDVRAAGGDVEAVAAPELVGVTTGYPVVALTEGDNPAGGAAFAGFVQSAPGRAILADHGFLAP